MSNPAKPQYEQIIQYFKQTDDVFHAYAVEKGLSDSSFWVLYSLCDSEVPYTQNDLCAELCYSKQTVHSSVSVLVKKGYVELEHVPGSRNSKHIILTEKGRTFADIHIQPLLNAEQRAFAKLSDDEINTYLYLVKKHLDLLESEVKDLYKE